VVGASAGFAAMASGIDSGAVSAAEVTSAAVGAAAGMIGPLTRGLEAVAVRCVPADEASVCASVPCCLEPDMACV